MITAVGKGETVSVTGICTELPLDGVSVRVPV